MNICILACKVSLPKVNFRGLWITGRNNKVVLVIIESDY